MQANDQAEHSYRLSRMAYVEDTQTKCSSHSSAIHWNRQ